MKLIRFQNARSIRVGETAEEAGILLKIGRTSYDCGGYYAQTYCARSGRVYLSYLNVPDTDDTSRRYLIGIYGGPGGQPKPTPEEIKKSFAEYFDLSMDLASDLAEHVGGWKPEIIE